MILCKVRTSTSLLSRQYPHYNTTLPCCFVRFKFLKPAGNFSGIPLSLMSLILEESDDAQSGLLDDDDDQSGFSLPSLSSPSRSSFTSLDDSRMRSIIDYHASASDLDTASQSSGISSSSHTHTNSLPKSKAYSLSHWDKEGKKLTRKNNPNPAPVRKLKSKISSTFSGDSLSGGESPSAIGRRSADGEVQEDLSGGLYDDRTALAEKKEREKECNMWKSSGGNQTRYTGGLGNKPPPLMDGTESPMARSHPTHHPKPRKMKGVVTMSASGLTQGQGRTREEQMSIRPKYHFKSVDDLTKS